MYITLQSLKDTLKITTNDEDALLTKFILYAQDIVERYTSRVFEVSSDSTYRFDAVTDYTYNNILFPDMLSQYNYYDICQITTVTNGDGVVIPSTDYITLPINQKPYYGIRLKLSSNVTFTWNNSPDAAIQVTGRWGYSITPPISIQYATERLAYILYRQKDVSADLDRAIITNQGVVQPNQLPKDVIEILDMYQRLV
jgi:hypothetical protein